MTIRLRYYQTDAINALFDYFRHKDGNPIVAMPTGTGKSLVIAGFIYQALRVYPKQNILVLTHVKELVDQNFKQLLRLWPTAPAGINSSGLGRRDYQCPILFAGIGSVSRKAHLLRIADLIIIDECHTVGGTDNSRYQTLISFMREVNPHVKVIGFSATPYRMGMGLLTSGGLYTDVCYDLTTLDAFNRLVDENYICPLITKRTTYEYDLSDVRVQHGEYVAKDLQLKVDVPQVNQRILDEVLIYGESRRHWLIFSSGTDHSMAISQYLTHRGITNCVIHSGLDAATRDQYLADYKKGIYRAAINYNVLTTGFDFPGIDFIAVLRPTLSTGLWVQMLGRGTRIYDQKENCLVLDFAGNTRKLGAINDPVIPKAKGKGGGKAPVKICEKCASYCHAGVRECPYCGQVFPVNQKLRITAATEAVMRTVQDKPQIGLYPVDRVTYRKHLKAGSPPTLLVCYVCGFQMFKSWICLEHPGYPAIKAGNWWVEASGNPDVPTDIDSALNRVKDLRTPSLVSVWTNRKYPEVIGVTYADK